MFIAEYGGMKLTMSNRKAYEELCRLIGNDFVLAQEQMKDHTTFRIGGPADVFVIPQKKEDVASVLNYCKSREVPYFIMGNGSNLLVSDKGFRGVIVQIFKNMQECSVCGEIITAQAGILLSNLAAQAKDSSLTGLEFASGIPGTLGGAVTMNAGAYGGEMKNVLRKVNVMDRDGNITEMDAEDLRLGYRTSLIKEKDWIVLSAELKLKKGDRKAIEETMQGLKEKRVSKQPLQYPSAGSTFKRPEGYFAGKLIQDAGLRGKKIGGAQVSEKHCGFVINAGGATAEDVRLLMKYVQDTVWDQFQVRLEPEVKFLGEF